MHTQKCLSHLGPPPQIGIVVACAELDQPRAALEVASFILERIAHRIGSGIEDHPIRIVVVSVDLIAATIRQSYH